MANINFASHDFYCINCGGKAMTLMRKMGSQREKFHRKRLYCPWCGKEINCVEIRNLDEKDEFEMSYERGDFINEAKESLDFVRISAQGQNLTKNYK